MRSRIYLTISLILIVFFSISQYAYDTLRLRGGDTPRIYPSDTETRIVENIIQIRSGLEEIKTKIILNDLVKSNKYGVVEYYTKDRTGCVKGKVLMHIDQIAVQNAFMAKGSVLPRYQHPDSIEILIVYEGELQVMTLNKIYRLQPGQFIRFLKGQSHKIRALQDTWLIGVTIPANSGYPK